MVVISFFLPNAEVTLYPYFLKIALVIFKPEAASSHTMFVEVRLHFCNVYLGIIL